jgi:hypothetical protein
MSASIVRASRTSEVSSIVRIASIVLRASMRGRAPPTVAGPIGPVVKISRMSLLERMLPLMP